MKSILFSLFQHFRMLPFGDAVREVFWAFVGILRALFSRSVDNKMLGCARTVVCESCPFYDAKWKTCGTPGDTMGDPLNIKLKIGCWCYLPLANRDPKKDCYARANEISSQGILVGWPDALRPSGR